jgi:hypothetical protein
VPLEDTTAPVGKKQGSYSFDQYSVLFCAGRAYYKNVITDSAWTQIADLALDTSVDYIYTCVVPASTFNYARKLEDNNQVAGTATTPGITTQNIIINGTASGLVVQDGINQGWLILPNGTARRLQTYEQWTLANREYVPIMKQMVFINGILFGMAPDGATILRSVSGRPLDFVINVTIKGDKGGDAFTTSYRASYNRVNFLGALNSGELFVATDTTCYPIEFNYDARIFAEPTFYNRKPFSAGIVNQFSFVDIRGDYGFIDYDGIRSFNAVAQLTNEGRNSVFSAGIQSALATKQTVTAATMFNNFGFFAVDTQFGNTLAVYDSIRQQWVCFDDYDMEEQFKMFSIANQSNAPFVYAITNTKLYKLFSGTETAVASTTLRATTASDLSAGIRLDNVYTVFTEASFAGDVDVLEIANGVQGKTVTHELDRKQVQHKRFNFKTLSGTVFKSQQRITWTNDAKLVAAGIGITGMTTATPQQQIVKQFNEAA